MVWLARPCVILRVIRAGVRWVWLSLKPRFSVPDFVSQLWRKIGETKSGTESLGWRLAVQPLTREAPSKFFGLPRPLPVTLEVRTEYLEATLAQIKHLEISKELIRECVTVPGCCCMPLLHNHLMDSCSYMYAKIHC